METVNFVRADEQVESPMAGPVTVDATPIVGHWINTNLSMPGIASTSAAATTEASRFACRRRAVRRRAVERYGRRGRLFERRGSQAAMAFVATYDRIPQTRVEANLSLGLLVVATFNTFRGGSGRFNFFAREFFYRAEDAPGQQSQEINE
jgi:hypothetical protein